MRKSLLSLAVLSALSIPTAVFAEEAAAPAAAGRGQGRVRRAGPAIAR